MYELPAMLAVLASDVASAAADGFASGCCDFGAGARYRAREPLACGCAALYERDPREGRPVPFRIHADITREAADGATATATATRRAGLRPSFRPQR